MRDHFAGGTFGDSEELLKLSRTASFESLSNVRHNRNTRISDLFLKTKIFGEKGLLRSARNLKSESPSHLPAFNFLECLERCHKQTSVSHRLPTRDPKHK